MPIRELLDEALLGRHLEEAMRGGELPIERLLAPVRDPAVATRTAKALATLALELPHLLLPGGPEVLSLGPALSSAGDADGAGPDLLLLEALRRGGRRPRYRAVSPSTAVLQAADRALATASPPYPVEGVRADLGDALHWDGLKALPGGTSRLVLALGGALGRWEPSAYVSELRRLLRRGNHLLIDAACDAEGDALERDLGDAVARALASLAVPAERVEVVVERIVAPALPGLEASAARAVVVFGPGPELTIGGCPVPAGVPLEVARETRLGSGALGRLLERVGAFDVRWAEGGEARAVVLARPSA